MKNKYNSLFWGNILFVLIGTMLFVGCSNTESQIQKLKDLDRPALDSIRNSVLNSYQDTIKIDTFFVVDKSDTVKVKFRHYCTFDKKINTPQQYLDVYKLSKFRTHNFVSQLDFKINSKTIYKGFITKDDFKNSLSVELKKYGVLKFNSPDIDVSGKTLSIEYGIGIPLSGTEWGYIMQIDSTGNKQAGSLD